MTFQATAAEQVELDDIANFLERYPATFDEEESAGQSTQAANFESAPSNAVLRESAVVIASNPASTQNSSCNLQPLTHPTISFGSAVDPAELDEDDKSEIKVVAVLNAPSDSSSCRTPVLNRANVWRVSATSFNMAPDEKRIVNSMQLDRLNFDESQQPAPGVMPSTSQPVELDPSQPSTVEIFDVDGFEPPPSYAAGTASLSTNSSFTSNTHCLASALTADVENGSATVPASAFRDDNATASINDSSMRESFDYHDHDFRSRSPSENGHDDYVNEAYLHSESDEEQPTVVNPMSPSPAAPRSRDLKSLRRATSPTTRRQLQPLKNRMQQGDRLEERSQSPPPNSEPSNVVHRHPRKRGPRRRRLKSNVRPNNALEKDILRNPDDDSSSDGEDVWSNLRLMGTANAAAAKIDEEEVAEEERKDRRFVADNDDDENLREKVEIVKEKRRRKEMRHENSLPISSRTRGANASVSPASGRSRGRSVTKQPASNLADLMNEDEQVGTNSSRCRIRFDISDESNSDENEVASPEREPAVSKPPPKRSSRSPKQAQASSTKRRSKLVDENGDCIPCSSTQATRILAEEAAEAAAEAASDAASDAETSDEDSDTALSKNSSSMENNAVDSDADSEDELRLPRRERLQPLRRRRATLRKKGANKRVEKYRDHRDAVEQKRLKGLMRQRKKTRHQIRAKQQQLSSFQAAEAQSHQAFLNSDEESDNKQSRSNAESLAADKTDSLTTLKRKADQLDQQIQALDDRKKRAKRIVRTLPESDDDDDAAEVDASSPENDDDVEILDGDDENDGAADDGSCSENENDDAEISVDESADEPDDGASDRQARRPNSDIENIPANPTFVVERIVRMIVRPRSRSSLPAEVMYEIKWVNYSEAENTEEPSSSLNGCFTLLQEFRRSLLRSYYKLLTLSMLLEEKNIPVGEYFPGEPSVMSSAERRNNVGSPLSPYNADGNDAVLYESSGDERG